MNEAAIRRIWQKLDRFNSGQIQVKDIVQNATFIQQECPLLLNEYERIARGGCVKYQDVRRLMMGLMESGNKRKAKPETPKPMSEEQAKELFDSLQEDGVITAKSLVAHKERVLKVLPALVHDFEKIDLDKDNKISWAELRVFVGGVAEWLEHELESVVGLAELKDQVRAFYRSLMLDETRRAQGHDVKGMAKTPHMIFQGNPGTGKTSLGRIMAKLLHRIGITSTPELKEVQRPDLVGEHVGQTGPKTQAIIDVSRSGVLFIDEAYRLTSVESKNDFGREAVETLMAAMNEPPGKCPVMIFAGYTRDMERFMTANEGLYRRIGYIFDFTDYEPADLAQILELIVSAKGFIIEPSLLAAERAGLAQLIESNTQPRSRALMNGGLCERVFDAAKQNLDARDDPEHPTVLLSVEDLQLACQSLPAPPEPPEKGGEVAAPESQPAPLTAAPAQMQMNSESASKNVWFHLGGTKSLPKVGGCCSGGGRFLARVRLDQREVLRTEPQPGGPPRSPAFDALRIIPYCGESLLEVVVTEGQNFVGSASLALMGLTHWNGEMMLKANDQPAGTIYLQVGWQFVSSVTGADSLKRLVGS